MKMVFQQKVAEKEAKLKQSEEELYARHREMKESLERQRADLEDKKRRLESGRPLTPEKGTVRFSPLFWSTGLWLTRGVRFAEEATWVPWWEINDLRVRGLDVIHSVIPTLRSLSLGRPLCVYSSARLFLALPDLVWICWPLTSRYIPLTLTPIPPPNYGGLSHSLSPLSGLLNLFVYYYCPIDRSMICRLFLGGFDYMLIALTVCKPACVERTRPCYIPWA